MKKYKVADECIGCGDCVEVAADNFELNENNIAFLKKQPEDEKELEQCEEAVNICPVSVISSFESDDDATPEVILAKSNIKTTLDTYPELKEILIKLSPKFKRMQNVALYNTLARFANFNDAAKLTGLSVCEILHAMNSHLGVENKLLKSMPECIVKARNDIKDDSVELTWDESTERFIYNDSTVTELVSKVSELIPGDNIVIISVEKPNELLKVATGLNINYNIEKGREYRVSFYNPVEDVKIPHWHDKKNDFEKLDARKIETDTFEVIQKKSEEINGDNGFVLIQSFEPKPMINMLTEKGFEHITDKKSKNEFWIYFYKPIS